MLNLINIIKLGALYILFTLVFISIKYLPLTLFALLFFSLFTIRSGTFKIKCLKKNIFIILFFIVNMLSLFYSSNFKEGWSTVQTQLSLFIIPFLVQLDKEFYTINKKAIIKLVLASFYTLIVIYVIISLKTDLYKIIELMLAKPEKGKLFMGIRWWLSHKTDFQHPTYTSLGLLMLLIFLFNSIKRNQKNYVIFFRGLSILLIIIIIYILNSRASLISFLIVILFYAIKFFYRNINVKTIIFFLLLVIGFTFIIINSRFHRNIIQLNELKSIKNIEKVDIRISIWKNASSVWKENFFFGHGIGDAKDRLVDIYKQSTMDKAAESRLNAHNQFLETAMQTGVIGLITLLLVFAIPLYQSIKKKQELLFLFLVICFINFLFESMLERLAGVVFFSFWYSFLWFVYYKDDDKKKEINYSSNPK